MSDDFDLDDLSAAMRDATPAPASDAKARNIALATKNFADLQGSRNSARHTTRPTKWTGVKDMLNKLTSRAGLTVTTAIVAGGFMIATPQGRDILNLAPVAKVAAPEAPVDPLADFNGSVSIAAAQAEEADGATLDAPIVTADIALDEAPMDMAAPQSGVRDQERLSQTAPSPAAPQRTTRVTPDAEPVMEMLPVIVMEETVSSSPFGGLVANAADAIDGVGDDISTSTTESNTETFAYAPQSPLMVTSNDPVSTFSIDVDTASYSVMRSFLTAGNWPPFYTIRIEELVNYFPYDYPTPEAGREGTAPFQPTVNVFETPWNADTQLVHIAIQGEMPAVDDRPPLNLVFLIDTSGSMSQPDKLPLLRQSFRLMLDNLAPEDEVAIVTYAGSTTIALEPTMASERATILRALNALQAGGSTNGQGGLEAAYAMADTMTQSGDVSRVILATDGDFNVGLSDPRSLETYIADKRDSGTYLSILGFGRGNLQDATMQSLAQNGNGTAAYIDTLSEAQKVLVDNLTGALFPIANDVKIQVEFNPATVAEYRLIGYETRALAREDFNNDAVDAGELGAGHTVTAIYEITPVGSPAQLSDPLRYQAAETTDASDELGFLRLRYKDVGDTASQLIETPFSGVGSADTEALFAASIAGFGQLLRDDTYLGDWGWGDAIALAAANRGDDPFGYRTEAVQLMRLAQSLSN